MARVGDMTGMQFGSLTVLGKTGRKRGGDFYWECRCSCGKVKPVSGYKLRIGHTKSCGCQGAAELVGQKFGRLTALEYLGTIKKHTKYKCLCDCGKTTIADSYSMRNGFTKSCGCLKTERMLEVGDVFMDRLVIEHTSKPHSHYVMKCVFCGKITQHVDQKRMRCKCRCRAKELMLCLYERKQNEAMQRGYVFDLTLGDFARLSESKCVYCGTLPSAKFYKYRGQIKSDKEYKFILYNGLDRVDNSIGYTVENTVPCCSVCNFMKHQHTYQDWISHMKKVIANESNHCVAIPINKLTNNSVTQ